MRFRTLSKTLDHFVGAGQDLSSRGRLGERAKWCAKEALQGEFLRYRLCISNGRIRNAASGSSNRYQSRFFSRFIFNGSQTVAFWHFRYPPDICRTERTDCSAGYDPKRKFASDHLHSLTADRLEQCQLTFLYLPFTRPQLLSGNNRVLTFSCPLHVISIGAGPDQLLFNTPLIQLSGRIILWNLKS